MSDSPIMLRLADYELHDGWIKSAWEREPHYTRTQELQYSTDGGATWLCVPRVWLGRCETREQTCAPRPPA